MQGLGLVQRKGGEVVREIMAVAASPHGRLEAKEGITAVVMGRQAALVYEG